MDSYPGFGLPPARHSDGSWTCARCAWSNWPRAIWCARCGLGAPPAPPPGYYQVPPVGPPAPKGPMPPGYPTYLSPPGQPYQPRSTRSRLGLFALMLVVIGILVIPAAFTDLAAYQTVTRPDFPVSVNGVKVAYYDITGASAAALVDAMQTRGTTSCGATDAIACLTYGFDWTEQTSTTSAGACTVTAVDLISTYQMILPRWIGPAQVPAGLVDWWGQVQTHLVWHESQHLKISQGYEPKLEAAIAAGPCDDPPDSPAAGVLAVKTALRAEQNQFDASDRSWTWPPYTGP